MSIDPQLVAQLVVLGFAFFMLLNSAAVLVYMERKVCAWVQQRYGPYLVGPHGAMQPLADILKLIMKEELRPNGADKVLFYLAPIISATAAFAAFAVVPFGAETTLFGLLDEPLRLQVADVHPGAVQNAAEQTSLGGGLAPKGAEGEGAVGAVVGVSGAGDVDAHIGEGGGRGGAAEGQTAHLEAQLPEGLRHGESEDAPRNGQELQSGRVADQGHGPAPALRAQKPDPGR